ncbi:WhiB family transcriptional regulator [Amycolatopsis sp. cmx-11-51]|uniref:WhiB family transcriptional regulator n=1 Tax=unclassified Amycolatopsis TaxID=2618356 RepID=UPI0039E58267
MADVSRLPRPITTLGDWQIDAACRELDSDMFFHPEYERGAAAGGRANRAKAVCFRCPVIQSCRTYALAVREPYGVWGGLTVAERAVVLSRRGGSAATA